MYQLKEWEVERLGQFLRGSFIGEVRVPPKSGRPSVAGEHNRSRLLVVRLEDSFARERPIVPKRGDYEARIFLGMPGSHKATVYLSVERLRCTFALQPPPQSWIPSTTEPVEYHFDGHRRVHGGRFHKSMLDMNRPAYLGSFAHSLERGFPAQVQPAYYNGRLAVSPQTLQQLDSMLTRYHAFDRFRASISI